MRWNGNGVANGTAVTSGNINTPGNGDSVSWGISGATGGAVYAGNGYEVWQPDTAIRRIDGNFPSASKHARGQISVTPRGNPGTHSWPLSFRSASATAASVGIDPAGLTFIRATNYNLPGSSAVVQSPALTLNNKFVFDMIVSMSPSPSTTNGRIIVRVTNLTDNTWNGTGSWYYDTGYTQNVNTADLTTLRMGANNGAWDQSTPVLYENLGWDNCDSGIAAASSRSQVEPYFMQIPSDNALPVVDAGPDMSVDPNLVDFYTLVPMAASDPDGTIASYLWEDVTSGTVSVGTSSSVNVPVSRATQLATKTYRLTVTDNSGGTATDNVVVTILPHTRWVKNNSGVVVPVRRRRL